MPNDAEPIASRVAQLEAIAARRNELLAQMYQLLQQRHGIAQATQLHDEESEGLQSFLKDLDLHKPGDKGFIQHHVARFLHQASDSPISSTLQSTLAGPSSTDTNAYSMKSPSRHEEEDDDETPDELDTLSNSRKNSDAMDVTSLRGSKPSVERDSSGVEQGNQGARGGSSAKIKQEETGEDDMNVDAQPSSEANELVYPDPPPTLTTEGTKDALFVPVTHAPVVVGTQQPHLAERTVSKSENATLQPVEPRQPERAALKATPTEVGVSPNLLSGQKSPILIPAPIEPSQSIDRSVELRELPERDGQPNLPHPPYDFQNPNLQYTLPPTSILPAEFSNRKKSSKRKKDRSDRKSDDLPMGLNRWAATLTANPVYPRVKRATKCMSTKDWSVAITELRLIRTIERIEKLKQEGRWGFRQTKKQRGVGGLMKTHWDYLMDEMKWMRTDFREERKWKLALAYNLSTSVLEWHALGSWEERVAHGVCVKWKSVQEAEQEDAEMDILDNQGNVEAPVQHPPGVARHGSLLGVDYASDDDDDAMDEASDAAKDSVDPLAPSSEIQNAIDAAADAKAEEEMRKEKESVVVAPKMEEVDDASALDMIKASQPEVQEPDLSGLKSTSKDPMLGSKSSSLSLNGDAEESKSNPAKVGVSAYAPTREKIVYGTADKLFIGPEDLDSFAHPPESADEKTDVYHSLGLGTLFPELQPYGMLDVAPAVVEPTKKRSGRSAEKDDPHKRVEETNYTKVMPTGQFMTLKPTILGPLEPATHWKDGKWLPMEEFAVTPDSESTSRITEESLCELFDFKVKSTSKGDGLGAKDARQPRAEQYWSSNDDLLLKSLIDKYPGNWNLIAECFNGCRIAAASDRRTAADCQDRWRGKWASDLQAKTLLSQDIVPHGEDQGGDGGESGTSMTPSTSATSMTTRGVKRMASSSVSSQQAPMIPVNEPKKRRRHLLIQETIRRATKKRQEYLQKMLTNQRKPQAQMHDTHVQLTKLAKVTPAELSRRKYEQEAKQMAELQNMRARQEDLTAAKAAVARAAPGLPQIPPNHPAAAQGSQQQQQAQGQQQAALGQPMPAQAAQLTQHQLQQQLLLQQAQAQANQNRPGSVAGGTQANVNITRISTPGAGPGVAVGGTRLPSHQQQIIQMQLNLAAQRSLSQQLGNGATTAVNGNTPNAGGSLVARDPTASPAHGASSPHVGANSPSPANAQASMMGQGATGAVRPAGSHYFNGAAGYPTDVVQMQRMLQQQQQQQQAAAALQQGQSGQ